MALAGAIPVIAGTRGLEEDGWGIAFAWVGHLAVAGIALWGLAVICVHACCLSSLIHGTGSSPRSLALAFITQLSTSSVVLLLFEAENKERLVATWCGFALLTAAFFAASYWREARRERTFITRAATQITWTAADPRPWRPRSR